MYLIKAISKIWEKQESIYKNEKWVKIIYDRDNKEPYLTRYYLLNTRFLEENSFIKKYIPFLKIFSFRLVMHNVHKSDEDGLHNHPWPWATLILKGGYEEREPIDKNNPETDNSILIDRKAGNLRFRKSTDYHRLELNKEKFGEETWTLFFMGPRKQNWGFLNNNNMLVSHEEYLEKRNYVLN